MVYIGDIHSLFYEVFQYLTMIRKIFSKLVNIMRELRLNNLSVNIYINNNVVEAVV